MNRGDDDERRRKDDGLMRTCKSTYKKSSGME